MKMHVFQLLAAAALVVACNREAPSSRGGTPAGDSVVAPAAGASSPAAAAKTPAKTNYVGLQYDSLPLDIKYLGGAVLPRQPRGPNADYDLAHVSTPMGEMIWLDTIGAPVGRGLHARIVRAELAVPPLASDERLFMASCDVNNRLDPEIVALAVTQPGAARVSGIRQAWRVNIRAARFDVIPIAGVTCEEPGS
jgi:hypothetical protein